MARSGRRRRSFRARRRTERSSIESAREWYRDRPMAPVTSTLSGRCRWSLLAAVACLGAACAQEPRRTEDAPAAPQPGADLPARPAAAASPRTAASGEPERFTFDQIAAAIGAMKKCVDRDASPRAMADCACRSDLALSGAQASPDVSAYCGAHADRFVAMTRLPEEEQLRSPILLAAPDVAPGSFVVFSYSVPCLIEASKAKSADRANDCVCVAHEVANRMVRHPLTTQAEVLAALEQAARESAASGRCDRPRPAP